MKSLLTLATLAFAFSTLAPNALPAQKPAAAVKTPDTFQVLFKTTVGDFTVECRRNWSPLGADRFYEMVKGGFFKKIAFFRVIPGFMAQFGIHGDPKVSGEWKRKVIADDATGRASNTRGMLSFATAGAGTRTTQMFINFNDRNRRLDGMGFTPFAKIVDGMKVVDKIYKVGEGEPRGPGPAQGRIHAEGNKYLKAKFPRLDYINEVFLLSGKDVVQTGNAGSPKAAGGGKAPKTFTVKFETTAGEIVIDCYREWSPLGADRFHELVTGGFFKNIAFFRVIPNFMAQFGVHGNPRIASQWRDKKIADDPRGKASNTRGMVSFATAGPGTRTTQMFINFNDRNKQLDGMGFTPFGKVVVGMKVVDKIFQVGEGQPKGPGPSQARLQAEGNKYLRKSYPKLDYITKATVMAEKDPLYRTNKPVNPKKGPASFKVKFETTEGDIVVEAQRKWAPHGVDRLHELVSSGFFKDVAFFRVMKGFIAQFGVHGDPKVSKAWETRTIEDDQIYKANKKGSLVFAKAGDDSRTTQLFFNLKNNSSSLDDQAFTPVAQIVSGMEVLAKIYSVGETEPPGTGVNLGKLHEVGNSYLRKEFPKLTYVKNATIVK